MKKPLKTALLSALVIIGPLSMAGAANAQTRRDVREERQDVRDARRDLREERQDVRNARQAQRWNDRQYNGYYVGGRFNYGRPSDAQMQRHDYRPGWQQWRRGDRLSQYHRSQYREIDWRRERLRQPPRGYHYVRDDRGEVLLVGIATGVILSILLNN